MDVTVRDDYVQIVIQDTVLTRETAERILSAVGQAREETGLRRFLLKFTSTEARLSVLGIYQLAHTTTKVDKLAVVVKPGQINRDMRFYEVATHNVGVGCKFFEGEDKALVWLRG